MDRAERDAIEARLQEEAEAAATPLLPTRRHDPVADWPASRLSELAAEHPELVDELIAKRGAELRQL